MAIQFQAYNNVTSRSATINVDVVAQLIAKDSGGGVSSFEMDYYIVANTTNRDTNNDAIPGKYGDGLGDLALNGAKKSSSDSSVDYSSVKEMVYDYVYDIINGHSDDQFLSGVSVQAPINLGQ